MANSIQYAKIASVPSVKVKTNELAGRVRVAFAEYEADAEQSTINMFVLPNGARIVRSRLAHDAMGSSTTISVGHAADAMRYLAVGLQEINTRQTAPQVVADNSYTII